MFSLPQARLATYLVDAHSRENHYQPLSLGRNLFDLWPIIFFVEFLPNLRLSITLGKFKPLWHFDYEKVVYHEFYRVKVSHFRLVVLTLYFVEVAHNQPVTWRCHVILVDPIGDQRFFPSRQPQIRFHFPPLGSDLLIQRTRSGIETCSWLMPVVAIRSLSNVLLFHLSMLGWVGFSGSFPTALLCPIPSSAPFLRPGFLIIPVQLGLERTGSCGRLPVCVFVHINRLGLYPADIKNRCLSGPWSVGEGYS